MSSQFSLARLPRIEFGRGTFKRIGEIASHYGQSALIVTGKRSFYHSKRWLALLGQLDQHQIRYVHTQISGEPSPQLIDEAVIKFGNQPIDVVIAIGGGSALDAGKAIAGLLKVKRTVMDYLEGVGPELKYEGPAVPLIAVPTTAGTGSEATKNAVLSVQGEGGFKKSFRDDKLVAEYAVVDPDLLASCPRAVIAANGMDALTQLMESYVSLRHNPMTSTLAVEGLRAVRLGLMPFYFNNKAHDRIEMAYASMLSGICLAQTGLGSVHGLASPLGAFYPIPHGVICGTLVAVATEINIKAMQMREPDNPALKRYKHVADILAHQHFKVEHEAYETLIEILTVWTDKLKLPRLGKWVKHDQDLDKIVVHSRGSSMQTNPIVLTDNEVRSIVERRL